MESGATVRKRVRVDPPSPSSRPATYYRDNMDVSTSAWAMNLDMPKLTSIPTLPEDEPSSTVPDPKKFGFIDAKKAGGSMAKECTLILTEGLSAKSFVMTFLTYVGTEIYGVYPLRGKIRNVRNRNVMIGENILCTDSKNIASALGLKVGVDADISKLRYGNVLIMADQDYDGIHIKGLLLNLFHHVWPSLLELKGFLQDFTTTLIKAKHKETKEECSFKSLELHEKWEVNQINCDNWAVKYYKGLASHSNKEALEYFQNIEEHLRVFLPCQDYKEKKELNYWMKVAFCKDSSESRKQWLKTKTNDGHGPDFRKKLITILDFIKTELILYFREDVRRSIPSVMDGLKPSQRKVLFFLFEKESRDQKVCDLSGKVSEVASYHHGDKVLQNVIIKMAQDFVGSNNINLLLPNGQFGSRREGGDDHGGARYIGTELVPISRRIFLQVDDSLVTHRREDGKSVEPDWYAPIVPMVLINGAMGIGTGYRTTVLCYKPMDLIENLIQIIDGKSIKEMVPWFRGFEGEVVPDKNHKGTYTVHAKWEFEDTKIKVDDLPPGLWYNKFEETLHAKKKNRKIKDYTKITAGGKVRYEIELIENCQKNEVEKLLKLSKKVSTSNLVLLDKKGEVKEYDDIEHVLKDFFNARLEIYEKRKVKLLEERKAQLKNAKSEEERLTLGQRIKDLDGIPPIILWKQDLESLKEWLCNEETCTMPQKKEETCTTGTGLAGILKSMKL